MIVYPNAKINLGLYVTDKRTDGYHNIESVFVPVSLTDILEFVPSDSLSFSSSGIEIPGDSSGNLCVKAWELLHADWEISPVAIHLHKQIPIGAGLGGGSADGAFMLKALNEFFGLKLSSIKLQEYALMLGSDCPFFIENKPALAKGRGELLESVSLNISQCKIYMVNPGIHVSTAEAYGGVKVGFPRMPLAQLLSHDVSQWQHEVENVFESSVFRIHPEISSIKQRLIDMGAVYAAMSGSGSTVYGLFSEDAKLNVAPFHPYGVFEVTIV